MPLSSMITDVYGERGGDFGGRYDSLSDPEQMPQEFVDAVHRVLAGRNLNLPLDQLNSITQALWSDPDVHDNWMYLYQQGLSITPPTAPINDALFRGQTDSPDLLAIGANLQRASGRPLTASQLERSLGIDPAINAVYSPVVSLWEKYFGRKPTAAEIQNLTGYQQTAPPARGTTGTATNQSLVQLAEQAGFPADVAQLMAAIGMAESGGNAGAVGDTQINAAHPSKGIWQIFTAAHPDLDQKYNLFDPVQNAQAAFEVYQSQGLGAWTTYKTGAYQQYLGQPGAVSGGGAAGGGAPLPTFDMQQLEDRIRSMHSHIGGLNLGQYTDLRSLADSLSQKALGHNSTDGIVKELFDAGQTSPSAVQTWYDFHSPNDLSAAKYNQAYAANAAWYHAIYNESGADPRVIAAQAGQADDPPASDMQQADMSPDLGSGLEHGLLGQHLTNQTPPSRETTPSQSRAQHTPTPTAGPR